MLVLSRKRNESIVISDSVFITVIEIRGDKVRLGVVAPAEVSVHRQEVFDAIRRSGGHDFKKLAAGKHLAEIGFEIENCVKYVEHLEQTDGLVPADGIIAVLEEIAAKCRAKEAA